MKNLLLIIFNLVFVQFSLAYVYFTEGDSFVLTSIDQNVINKISKQKTLEFESLSNAKYSIKVNGDVQKLKVNILNTYKRYRKLVHHNVKLDVSSVNADGSVTGKIDYEIDPLMGFIYNKTYDVEKYLLGFKYNENWLKDNQPIIDQRYLPESWMYRDNFFNAKRVEGLKANLGNDIVEVDADDICVILISLNHLKNFYDREVSKVVTITKVTNETVEVYVLNNTPLKSTFQKVINKPNSLEFKEITYDSIRSDKEVDDFGDDE